jgi:hypothetical protein
VPWDFDPFRNSKNLCALVLQPHTQSWTEISRVSPLYSYDITSLDAPPSATYTLIHAFLNKRGHTKAAQALKKAAADVVVLKDDITPEGPQLDEIIQQWKELTEKKES